MGIILAPFFSEQDQPIDRQRKRVVIPATIVVVVLTAVVVFSAFVTDEWHIGASGNSVCLTVSFLLGIKNFVTKKLTTTDITILMVTWSFTILIFDSRRAGEMQARLWPFVVLVLDIILLCSLHPSVSNCVVAATTLYLVIDTFEKVFRFGLYDIRDRELRSLQCFNLTPEELNSAPCEENQREATIVLGAYLALLILDFLCTRNFAKGMQHEQQKLEASVLLAETVAAALVRFDLEEAKVIIDREENNALTEVLNQLLRNLHQYRPYLPNSLFSSSEECTHDTVRPPQGDEAAILFTDLKSSTAIWEASPDAMKRALKIHNNIIRGCMAEFGGYEVKTIGDSFMVAFESLFDGCSFAMSVQKRLAVAIWPSDLMLPPVFEKNSWNGLMVRIGIHYGEVEAEINPLSGRTDYLGRSVNKAARLEGVCTPGGVAIDSDFKHEFEMIEGWDYKEICETLKGIDDSPTNITILTHKHFTEDENSMYRSLPSTIIDLCTDISTRISVSACQTLELLELDMMKRKSATVCNANLTIDTDYDQDIQTFINMALGKAIFCVERTDGTIVSVLASSITIGWNTSKYLSAHFHNALRFVSLMYGTFPSLDEVFIGVSSSSVHSGRVGTSEQKFITVYGDCVGSSHQLCQAASDFGAFALCANTPIDVPIKRPVDRWVQNTKSTIIYELHVNILKEWITQKAKNQTLSEAKIDLDWGWSEEYLEAFDKMDWEAIQQNMSPFDRVLLRVTELTRTGKSLRVDFPSFK